MYTLKNLIEWVGIPGRLKTCIRRGLQGICGSILTFLGLSLPINECAITAIKITISVKFL